MGGRSTVLVDAVERNLPRVGNTPTIIFGADVSHPHPGEGPYSLSIAAVRAYVIIQVARLCKYYL